LTAWEWKSEELPSPLSIYTTVSGVRGLARLALDIFQVLGVPEPQHFQHAPQIIIRVANGNEGVRLVEVVPVFEVRRRLQELCGERESDGSNVCNANEPA
jgi:hypothetical protein